MKSSLEKHLSNLDYYPTRNAYMLCGDIDPRACCKSLRERLKRLLPTVEYHAVWLRKEDGVLLIVADPSVLSRILSDMFQEAENIYSGAGRKVIRDLVYEVLGVRYVPAGRRSFGHQDKLRKVNTETLARRNHAAMAYIPVSLVFPFDRGY